MRISPLYEQARILFDISDSNSSEFENSRRQIRDSDSESSSPELIRRKAKYRTVKLKVLKGEKSFFKNPKWKKINDERVKKRQIQQKWENIRKIKFLKTKENTKSKKLGNAKMKTLKKLASEIKVSEDLQSEVILDIEIDFVNNNRIKRQKVSRVRIGSKGREKKKNGKTKKVSKIEIKPKIQKQLLLSSEFKQKFEIKKHLNELNSKIFDPFSGGVKIQGLKIFRRDRSLTKFYMKMILEFCESSNSFFLISRHLLELSI